MFLPLIGINSIKYMFLTWSTHMIFAVVILVWSEYMCFSFCHGLNLSLWFFGTCYNFNLTYTGLIKSMVLLLDVPIWSTYKFFFFCSCHGSNLINILLLPWFHWYSCEFPSLCHVVNWLNIDPINTCIYHGWYLSFAIKLLYSDFLLLWFILDHIHVGIQCCFGYNNIVVVV